MRRRRADRLQKKVKFNPEALAEAKRSGIAVGKRVRYSSGSGVRWGVVRAIRQKSVRGQQSVEVGLTVEVELTAGTLLMGGENIVIREDEVPLASVLEILGDGRLAERQARPVKAKRPLPMAPPRTEGYEACDIGNCEERPTTAYLVSKADVEVGVLAPGRIIAVCREHDEPYIEGQCQLKHDHAVTKKSPITGQTLHNVHCVYAVTAHIPLLWRLGVVFDEYAIPAPETAEE